MAGNAGGEARARILDVTRLVSRLGRGPLTGIDRVEGAYLRELAARPAPLHLLCRTDYGYILAPCAAAAALLGWLAAPETLPEAGLVDRLRGRAGAGKAPHAGWRQRGEAGLRRMAVGRAPHRGLARLVARALPQGGSYLAVGHAGLSAPALERLRRAGLRIGVMIHDTIPLDHPDFAREGEPARFAAKFAAVAAYADVILCNSAATRDAIAARLPSGGEHRLLVAHLGIEVPHPDPAALPAGCDLGRPRFVVLGTIEPRKNHALLLNIWDRMALRLPEREMPLLFIVGRRGWAAPTLFDRLDGSALRGRSVIELPGLSDAAVAALVQGARGLLMPSRAEGFGLPCLEALQLGTPVMASPLPVHRELMGAAAVYGDPDDGYAWQHWITAQARLPMGVAQSFCGGGMGVSSSGRESVTIPTWTAHFDIVLNAL